MRGLGIYRYFGLIVLIKDWWRIGVITHFTRKKYKGAGYIIYNNFVYSSEKLKPDIPGQFYKVSTNEIYQVLNTKNLKFRGITCLCLDVPSKPHVVTSGIISEVAGCWVCAAGADSLFSAILRALGLTMWVLLSLNKLAKIKGEEKHC